MHVERFVLFEVFNNNTDIHILLGRCSFKILSSNIFFVIKSGK